MQEEREEAVSASVYKINQGKRRKMTNDLRERENRELFPRVYYVQR